MSPRARGCPRTAGCRPPARLGWWSSVPGRCCRPSSGPRQFRARLCGVQPLRLGTIVVARPGRAMTLTLLPSWSCVPAFGCFVEMTKPEATRAAVLRDVRRVEVVAFRAVAALPQTLARQARHGRQGAPLLTSRVTAVLGGTTEPACGEVPMTARSGPIGCARAGQRRCRSPVLSGTSEPEPPCRS